VQITNMIDGKGERNVWKWLLQREKNVGRCGNGLFVFLPCYPSLFLPFWHLTERLSKSESRCFFENQSNFRPVRRPPSRTPVGHKNQEAFVCPNKKNIEERFLWPISCHHRDAPSKKRRNEGMSVFNRGAGKAFVFASNTTLLYSIITVACTTRQHGHYSHPFDKQLHLSVQLISCTVTPPCMPCCVLAL